MKTVDEKLSEVQKLMNQIRDLTYHEHNKKVGDKTIYEHWRNADSAITTLRTVIKVNDKTAKQ